MVERFDAIVVGAGAMGTAAARELAERGRDTLVLERFALGHANGSSGGPTRIFRLTYEHPDYVRMARRAVAAWRELEDRSGERLLHTTGGVDLGEGARRSAEALEAAGEAFAWIDPEEATERWPGLAIRPGTPVLLQEEGGVCMAERTVLAQARLAREAGATLREATVVEGVTDAGSQVEVRTAAGAFTAPVVVVAAGAWATRVLSTAGIELPLSPSLEQVSYLRLVGKASAFPALVDWSGETTREADVRAAGSSIPYAVPDPEHPGAIKLALDRSGPAVDPDRRSFEPDPDRVRRVRTWAELRFRPLEETRPTETCLYTNAPDGEFVLDRVGNVVIGSACSGHGFKFTPLVGKILADLATGAPVEVPLDAFGARRAWAARHLRDRAFPS